MTSLTDFMYWLDDLLWGNAMTVVVVGTGILLSLRFGFAYQRRIGFNFKNTFFRRFRSSADRIRLLTDTLSENGIKTRLRPAKDISDVRRGPFVDIGSFATCTKTS